MSELIPLPDPSTQYGVGATFELFAHVAPPPKEDGSGRVKFTKADCAVESQPDGRLQHCSQYTVQPHSKYPSHQIILRKGLSIGLSHLRFAQVWMVECDGRTMLARFYDPLYVLDDTGAYNIFLQTNERVETEVAAYTALSRFQGSLIPRFFGYFLAMVPAPPGLEDRFPPRSVQVVLLEFFPGESLRALGAGQDEKDEDEDCDPQRDIHFTFVCDEHKTAILDAVRLANHLFILSGVQHIDLLDRNVLLKETRPSHTAFCSSAECALQHRLCTESLITQLASQSGAEPVDYSVLTLQQIDSLPI
ncbi:hypothetical protein FB45DRAFT_1061993 [Roridomyces roridus]|uniref:Uncharacterized protein n=1 Tax=Roridomyces roridus TaxID=1738132 RepID=A0AAD7FFE2_9AGAR|nr:hypothetical protein FB45DRAFT_1061993 [Roridomyces roridus]